MDKKKGFTLNAIEDDALDSVVGGVRSVHTVESTDEERLSKLEKLQEMLGSDYDLLFGNTGGITSPTAPNTGSNRNHGHSSTKHAH